MVRLFAARMFQGFGPSRLQTVPGARAILVQAPRPGGLRQQIRQVCPRRPGVYGMLNSRGAVIYVGKAKQLRARLLTYFRSRSRDPKAGRILAHTRAVAWEYVPSEFAALLRELELIQRWRPRFNVQGQPQRRRRTFVCLGRHPAAYVFLTRRPLATALALFGPIPAGDRAPQLQPNGKRSFFGAVHNHMTDQLSLGVYE